MASSPTRCKHKHDQCGYVHEYSPQEKVSVVGQAFIFVVVGNVAVDQIDDELVVHNIFTHSISAHATWPCLPQRHSRLALPLVPQWGSCSQINLLTIWSSAGSVARAPTSIDVFRHCFHCLLAVLLAHLTRCALLSGYMLTLTMQIVLE